MKNRSTDPKPTAATDPTDLTLGDRRELCRKLAAVCRTFESRLADAQRLLLAGLPAEDTEEDLEATIRCEGNLWWTVNMTIGNAIRPDIIESLGDQAERLEHAARCTDESLREAWLAEERSEIVRKYPNLSRRAAAA